MGRLEEQSQYDRAVQKTAIAMAVATNVGWLAWGTRNRFTVACAGIVIVGGLLTMLGQRVGVLMLRIGLGLEAVVTALLAAYGVLTVVLCMMGAGSEKLAEAVRLAAGFLAGAVMLGITLVATLVPMRKCSRP